MATTHPSPSQHTVTEREGEREIIRKGEGEIKIIIEGEGEITTKSSDSTDLLDTQLTPNHNPMDRVLYKAVMKGDVEYLDQRSELFDNQVTPNHNTILHVAAHFGKKECVDKILQKKPDLIQRLNKNGENLLHIAVKERHLNIVQALIDGAKESHRETELRERILRATNKDGDTPLHLAVREGDNALVRLLANQDLGFQYLPNKAKETPLYLAAERKDGVSMVKSILACGSPAYTGPSGRTALHASAISGNTESIKELLDKLLDQNNELIDQADDQGWTPLHYAAYYGHTKAVGELLERNNLGGYKRTTKEHDEGIALHIAAAAANEHVIAMILSHCPDCWEMVNSRGRNILHIAVDMQAICVIDYITTMGWLVSLMNKKDNDGNTPLHLLASSEMKPMDDLINNPRAYMYAVNSEKKTPAEVAMSINKEKNRRSWFLKARSGRNITFNEEHKATMTEDFALERGRNESEGNAENKTPQNHMLVATLIVTITFAAGFTIPGGYETQTGLDEGMAVLVRKASFRAFIVANTIAMMCSTSSVLFYVFAALYDDDDEEDCNTYSFYLILVAIAAMTVGFLSGTYAMLVHSLGLKIATSFICGLTFVIYFWQLKRFYSHICIAKRNNRTGKSDEH